MNLHDWDRRCLNCGNLLGLVAYSTVYCSAACYDEHKDGRERAREGT